VVLGRHVDRLKFLDVMFGDQPALSPAELVYQRVLARDPVEAAEQAQKYLKEKPLLAYYQEVLIEALKLAQADAERGALDHERMLHIRDSVAELVDDLAGHEDKPDPTTQSDAKADEEAPLAQISKTEESLSRRGKNCRNGGGVKHRFCAFRAPGCLTKQSRLSWLSSFQGKGSALEPSRPMHCRCRAFSVWIQRMSRWCAFAMWKMQLRRRFAMRSGACAEEYPMHLFS